MTIPLQPGIVYGPVSSRRLGCSLGVNLLPGNRKACNFNCAYCQYGWTPVGAIATQRTWPAPVAVALAVEGALRRNRAIDCITLAGNGEPTLHPGFGETVERLRLVRDRLAPGVRIAVLSNSSTLGRAAVVSALRRVDDRYMKLDAGDDGTLRRLNGARLRVDAIVEGLQRLDRIVVQAMFVQSRGRLDNTTPEAVNAWLHAIRRVGPSAVHLYTLDRTPASRRIEPVARPVLDAIASLVSGAGIPARVF